MIEKVPAGPPKLRTVYLVAGVAALMTFALLFKTYRSVGHPLPNWMTSAQRWYDSFLGAVFWGWTFGACVHYAIYRRRLLQSGQDVRPRRWHQRGEVRSLLYLFAILQFIQLPIAIWRTLVALNDSAAPAFANTVVSLFPIEGILCPIVGIAVIYYDRRRTERERHEGEILCLTCGYDLRASVERCPECGSKIGRVDGEPGSR